MAISTVTKNLNDGSLALEDGTGPPVTLTVPVSVGDTTISNLRAVSGITGELNEVVAYETRGKLDGVRHTSRVYPEGSFTVHFREFTSAAVGVVLDFIRRVNAYSANASTLGANADVYTVKITLTVEGTDHGDGADAVIVLDDCHCTADFAEGDPNTLTISYVSYALPATTGTSA
jgi:hypothetical protein